MTLIDAAAVAERLGVSERTVRDWTSTKRIPHVKLSARIVRYDPAAIDTWLREQEVAA